MAERQSRSRATNGFWYPLNWIAIWERNEITASSSFPTGKGYHRALRKMNKAPILASVDLDAPAAEAGPERLEAQHDGDGEDGKKGGGGEELGGGELIGEATQQESHSPDPGEHLHDQDSKQAEPSVPMIVRH